MGDDKVPAVQFGNRLKRLLRMIATRVPAKLIANECILIAEAACRMGHVPIETRRTAQRLHELIEAECAKPEVKARLDAMDKEVEAMGEEVHSEGCPAYDMWIKMAMPAGPGECTCGGANRGKKP